MGKELDSKDGAPWTITTYEKCNVSALSFTVDFPPIYMFISHHKSLCLLCFDVSLLILISIYMYDAMELILRLQIVVKNGISLRPFSRWASFELNKG